MLDELANLQRINTDEDEREDEEQRQTRVANALHHEGIPLTPRAEAAIANYMVRKYSGSLCYPFYSMNSLQNQPSWIEL